MNVNLQGLRAEQPDRGDVLGEFLPGPELGPRPGGAGRHHRPHNGHSNGVSQQVHIGQEKKGCGDFCWTFLIFPMAEGSWVPSWVLGPVQSTGWL